MIINREYIIDRLNKIASEKQKSQQHAKNKADKLFDIKQRFPKWLRSVLFHPYNPAYSVYLQKKALKNRGSQIYIEPLHPYSIEFFNYILNNDVQFDTSLYFPKEDEEKIISFIDYRLKALIPGYTHQPMNDYQKRMMNERIALTKQVKKKGNKYYLTLDNNSYILPGNSYNEQTYIHDYGLKYLPDSVLKYIEGKDFLDLGAYIGDVTIMFLKKYNPHKIYAYEPVGLNIELLEQTIKDNKTDRIIPVKKGIGDKEEEIEMHLNLTNLTSSSISTTVIYEKQSAVEKIQISTIDNECKDRKIGLIKMDIEGAEYAAIKGSMETIKRDKPVLLISAYHTAKDFFEIIPMLKEAVPSYQFRYVDLDAIAPLIDKVFVAYPET